MKKQFFKIIMGLSLLVSASAAQAALIEYVGSWQVGDGPNWSSNPLAYSGVGAAEELFGAGTYMISTIDDQVANINNMAHYAIIGIGFEVFAEDYFRGVEGITRYQDVYIFDRDLDTVSAYVRDFGVGGTNYAFRISDVPAPAPLAMLGLGLAGLAFFRKKKAA
ncbi:MULTISPECIES: PEP-CTERM sorting domain-containing protein [Corallincola]|uniref:PEP-CTERM sorting domain-containing protein n=2 Tax=Corallincola TaxID=1775176 RepID=A0ABY1WLI9_9GAMM|nr:MULTISPECIES: PEP-CTERM sorting domain-containing protein [Corallincola]TAA41711.1 PEP-CTERM sorting domain-containing protein [Corallincola spongiicola]TCI01142.1 PEP-CTERM sorting domain-containing protein [Corallincola luteus]